MIKSFTAGVCIVALTGSLAFAQPSQSQGAGNAGTSGTSDTTMQNGAMKNTTGGTNTTTGMTNSGTNSGSSTGAAGGTMARDGMSGGMKKDNMGSGNSK